MDSHWVLHCTRTSNGNLNYEREPKQYERDACDCGDNGECILLGGHVFFVETWVDTAGKVKTSIVVSKAVI